MTIKRDKQGRLTTLIKFTRKQRECVDLLLKAGRDTDGEGAIIGQVLSSGIAAKFLDPKEAQAIAKITGAGNGYVHFPEQQT